MFRRREQAIEKEKALDDILNQNIQLSLHNEVDRKRILGQLAYKVDELILQKVGPNLEGRAIYTFNNLLKRQYFLTVEEMKNLNDLQINNTYALTASMKKLKDNRFNIAHPVLPSVENIRKLMIEEFGNSRPMIEIVDLYDKLLKI